jgi:hypothetical protein
MADLLPIRLRYMFYADFNEKNIPLGLKVELLVDVVSLIRTNRTLHALHIPRSLSWCLIVDSSNSD